MAIEDIASPVNDIESTLKKFKKGMRIILDGAKAETGQTPKEVIWTKNKAQLYHYVSPLEKRFPVPILLVYALINRPYVLDLMPGNSLVEYLVGKGFDVYMLDWGTAGDEDKEQIVLVYRLAFDHVPVPVGARQVEAGVYERLVNSLL